MSPQLASSSIAAVVLAAGTSTRFGAENKLLHEIDGTSVLAATLRPLLQLELGEVIVVVGHEEEAVRAALPGDDIRTVVAEEFSLGMGHSIAAGIAALPSSTEAAFVVLGDMPWMPVQVYRDLMESLSHHAHADACVPVHDGRWGNPVLFRATAFPALRALHGDRGAKKVLKDGTLSVTEVPCATPEIFADLDVPPGADGID